MSTYLHLALLIFLTAYNFQYVSAQNCPNEFTMMNDRCYMFSFDYSINKTWEVARTYCQSFTEGGNAYDLLIITDDEEYYQISEQLINREKISVFVGAIDLGETAYEWFWVNLTRMSNESPLWDCSHPNDFTFDHVGQFVFVTSTEECNKGNTYRVTNVAPSTYSYFICEGPLKPDCPGGYINVNDRCYFFSLDINIQNTWEGARVTCNSYTQGVYTYDLLIINDDNEYSVISDMLTNRGIKESLIGAIDLGLSEYEYFWVNGTRLHPDNPLWDCDNPNAPSFDYVALFAYIAPVNGCEKVNTFRLRNIPRTSYGYFICEGGPM